MERSSSNGDGGALAFRFSPEEVAEMEALVQQINYSIPNGLVLDALANKFTASRHRAGGIQVQSKQVLYWFRKRRYSREGKASLCKQAPQMMALVAANQHQEGPILRAQAISGRNPIDDVPVEYIEAKSTRDGAWYDVAAFLFQRGFETDDPELRVRFSRLGGEEDEWVNVRAYLQQRSLPFEAR